MIVTARYNYKMMFTYKEGTVTLLYIPYEDAELNDVQRQAISAFLFACNIPVPNWDEYNDILEGYVIEDMTNKKECWEEITNDDDHIDSYFHMEDANEYCEEVTSHLRRLSGIDSIMFCRGTAGFCDLPALAH